MKKISWIASYPKSGNTYIRLLLSAYFYSTDGIISDFNTIENIFKISRYAFLKNIKNVPEIDYFIKNPKISSKYWLPIQKEISSKIKTNLFIKTHDCMAKINNTYFTNKDLTKCFIYIVRDPRSIAVSYSHHTGYDLNKTIKYLINKNYIINYQKTDLTIPELVSSWAIHYNSWKNFANNGLGLIIKYEELVQNPIIQFRKILLFLKNFINFEINEKKLINCVNSTNLQNLKKIENKKGFLEKPFTSKKFFRKGVVDEWTNVLNNEQIKLIENNFFQEMKTLEYL